MSSKKFFFELIKSKNKYRLGKIHTRRGIINCSIKDNVGWRWFGVQFVIRSIEDN